MNALNQAKCPWPGSPVILIALASLLALPACQLLNPLGSPSPTARSTQAVLNFPLALRWQRSLDCTSVLPPEIWEGVLIVPNDHCQNMSRLYALDVQSGNLLWQRGGDDFAATNLPGSRLSQEGKLVVGTDTGVQALDLRTGGALWSAPSFMAVTNVVYGKGKIFAGVDWYTFSAYDLETGRRLWQTSVDGRSWVYYDVPSQSLITVPIAFSGTHYWLDPASGQVLRSKPMTERAKSTTFPVVANGKLYYGAFVMDATNASLLCAHPKYAEDLNPGSIYYDLPLSDNALYISTESSVVAFDTLACQLKWEYRPQGWLGLNRPEIVSNPAILGEVVYAIFSDGTLRAINRQSGLEVGYWQANEVKYSFTDNSAIPGVAVSNDTLIASFGNGEIYAFGP